MNKILLTCLMAAVPGLAYADSGRYIVKFNEGRGAAGLAAARAAGGRVVLELRQQNAAAVVLPAQAVAALERNPNVEYVEEDVIRIPLAADRPLATGETLPYGVQMVQADLVTSGNEGGKKICIIDSGYSPAHQDLRAANVTFDNDPGSGSWEKDSCGHGTHVAGTVMATAGNSAGVVGVLPGARLHIVKVFGNDILEGGACEWTYSSTLVAALNKCEAAGSNVTSMSLGGGAKSRTEELAFRNSYGRGMLHVAAAGNDGSRATSYPAGYASVVSVAAVDANGAKADFSQTNRDVEIAAPGVGVLSTVPWLDANDLALANGTTVSGGHVEFSARGTASGGLVDGGLCTAPGAWAGKVVLCQRGTVSFNDKVQSAQNGGAAAAVIYNNVASDPTCGDFAGTLGAGNSSVIPAIAVSCADGATALAQAGSNATVTSTITYQASGYEAWNGTSMATPHVSAVAALVWGCFPGASNQTIRDTLNATALDVGPAGRDTSFGYGIVQAKAAVTALGASAFCTTSATSKY